MIVIYKQTLNPLYTFEKKDIRIHDVAKGAKIVLKDGYLWEIHGTQFKKHLICNVKNVIEIAEEEQEKTKGNKNYNWCDVCDFLAVDKVTGYCHVCNK